MHEGRVNLRIVICVDSNLELLAIAPIQWGNWAIGRSWQPSRDIGHFDETQFK